MTQENPTQAATVVKELNEGDTIEVEQYATALKVTHTGELNGEENAFIGLEFVGNQSGASKSMVVNQNSGRVYLSAGTTDKGEVTEIDVTETAEDDEDDDNDENSKDCEECGRTIPEGMFDTCSDCADEETGDSDETDTTEVVADGGQVELPSNETVRLITGITGVMHTPEVIEGETSSTGKTIAVEHPHKDKTYRLDTAEILEGESEFRSSTYFELYTPARLQNRQRSNRAPGPQAGTDDVSDREDLPEPTHTLPGDDGDDEADATDSEDEDAEGDEGSEESAPDKWDLSQYDRGTELILEAFSGTYVVVNRKTTQFGDVLALDVVGPDDELLRLRKVDLGGYSFEARKAECDGGIIREVGGTKPVRNVDHMDQIHDFEAVGTDTQRLREWIRSEYR